MDNNACCTPLYPLYKASLYPYLGKWNPQGPPLPIHKPTHLRYKAPSTHL